ncbi:MAG: c-type cytochrome [Actinomycetota bacterium]
MGRCGRFGMLVCAGAAAALLASPRATVRAQEPPPDGGELYLQYCASCHGAGAGGTANGPSLLGVGPAAVDFQLRTGRMPLSDPARQAQRKPSPFEPQQIEALVDYVASLSPGGPAIPSIAPEQGDLAAGSELFINECAPCHGATGNGGAVGADALAPPVGNASPLEVAEATLTGPGQMPRFAFSPEELDAIVAFTEHLRTTPAHGGADIGGIGSVPEGFVAWFGGALTLVVIAYVVGKSWGREG